MTQAIQEATAYLSRLVLNPASRWVRRDLANCHALHRTIMSGFPNLAGGPDARARLGVLYRVEPEGRRPGVTLLVQSAIEPSWPALPDGYLLGGPDASENPDSKPLDPLLDALRPGLPARFRLRANPTKRVSHGSPNEPESAIGKRVDLRREEDQLEWLRRKGEQSGFRPLDVRANPARPAEAAFGAAPPVPDVRASLDGKVTGWRPDRSKMTFGSVTFDGLLQITDVERFRRALIEGVGSGKAYGFGLLSIAPATAGSWER